VIVAEDADIAVAVKAICGSKFRTAGQVCILLSPTRFLVHKSIAPRSPAPWPNIQGLEGVDGLEDGTQMGPPLATQRRSPRWAATRDALDVAPPCSRRAGIGDAGNSCNPRCSRVPLTPGTFNDEPFVPGAGIRTSRR